MDYDDDDDESDSVVVVNAADIPLGQKICSALNETKNLIPVVGLVAKSGASTCLDKVEELGLRASHNFEEIFGTIAGPAEAEIDKKAPEKGPAAGDTEEDGDGDYDACDHELTKDEVTTAKAKPLRPALEKFSNVVEEGMQQVKPVIDGIEGMVITKCVEPVGAVIETCKSKGTSKMDELSGAIERGLCTLVEYTTPLEKSVVQFLDSKVAPRLRQVAKWGDEKTGGGHPGRVHAHAN